MHCVAGSAVAVRCGLIMEKSCIASGSRSWCASATGHWEILEVIRFCASRREADRGIVPQIMEEIMLGV